MLYSSADQFLLADVECSSPVEQPYSAVEVDYVGVFVKEILFASMGSAHAKIFEFGVSLTLQVLRSFSSVKFLQD